MHNTRQRIGAARKKIDSGFTLIEVLITLSILGVSLTFAGSSFGHWLSAMKLKNEAQLMTGAFMIARSEAIKRGARVTLCKSPDGRECTESGGWEQGFITFQDHNQDGNIDPDEPVLRVQPRLAHGVTMSGNRPIDDYISFTSHGSARLANGALQMGTLKVCMPGQHALQVVLANAGRARLQKSTLYCS